MQPKQSSFRTRKNHVWVSGRRCIFQNKQDVWQFSVQSFSRPFHTWRLLFIRSKIEIFLKLVKKIKSFQSEPLKTGKWTLLRLVLMQLWDKWPKCLSEKNSLTVRRPGLYAALHQRVMTLRQTPLANNIYGVRKKFVHLLFSHPSLHSWQSELFAISLKNRRHFPTHSSL